MVTANVARGVGITLAAVGGMFLGFYVQDDMMRKSEKRVEDRVRAQVDRVVADREAKLKAAGR